MARSAPCYGESLVRGSMKNKMWSQILLVVAVVASWFVLQRWVLPALGMRT